MVAFGIASRERERAQSRTEPIILVLSFSLSLRHLARGKDPQARFRLDKEIADYRYTADEKGKGVGSRVS